MERSHPKESGQSRSERPGKTKVKLKNERGGYRPNVQPDGKGVTRAAARCERGTKRRRETHDDEMPRPRVHEQTKRTLAMPAGVVAPATRACLAMDAKPWLRPDATNRDHVALTLRSISETSTPSPRSVRRPARAVDENGGLVVFSRGLHTCGGVVRAESRPSRSDRRDDQRSL